MSPQLTSRSDDLSRLVREGYAVEIRHGYLLVHDIPYVDPAGDVRRGTLVSTLALAGDVTQRPDTHVAMFIGDEPCDASGRPIEQIRHSGGSVLASDLTVNFSFSSKPNDGYPDYFDKMTTYANIISVPAQQKQPDITARTYRVLEDSDEQSVFRYVDTASSRAEIVAVSDKLAVQSVAIVGLGGTGAYILDLLAKTPVREIHLFDGDRFSQHNAFRAPGATSIEELTGAPPKVAHYAGRYGLMRDGIMAHPEFIDETNVHELSGMDCVFICVDRGDVRRLIIDALENDDATFIDVGMGIQLLEESLALFGQLRVTTSVPGRRDAVPRHVPTHSGADDDVYAKNIQVADLNALNAALAVIRWKKLCGFYNDTDHELHSVYAIDGNALLNEERPA